MLIFSLFQAFPKGSPLVPDVSSAIVSLTELNRTEAIRNFWLGDGTDCASNDISVNSESLTLESFKGLFLIAGLSATSALCIFLVNFLRENKQVLNSQDPLKQKIATLVKTFIEKKEDPHESANKVKTPEREAEMAKKVKTLEREAEMANFDDIPQGFIIRDLRSPATISLSNQEEGISSQDEGLSSAEPGTPYHDFTTVDH